MKITAFENEDAIELLADIIEPAGEIFADPNIKSIIRGAKNKSQLIQAILRDHKSAIIQIFARLNCVPVEEYKCNIITLTKDLLDLLNDQDLIAVFTLQDQKKASTFSGSATGNTEGKEA